ncbi:insulinase family protein [bacterium]|nr:insulinase family protein [bacterium]
MSVRYRKTRLDSGLRVVTESMPRIRSVSIGVWITSGSRHETARTGGLSHLLEHMAFKGTVRRSSNEIAVSLESLGGHLNAFTEKEFTCFCALVLDEHLEQAVDVLADIVQHPVLRPRDLRSEKGIIQEEIRNVQDTPEDLIHERFVETVYPRHPLGAPILGFPSSLRRIGREDLIRYRKSRYLFSNCIVSAAGNVDHRRLCRLIDGRFRDLGTGRPARTRPPGIGSVRTRSVHAPISQGHVCTGAPGVSYTDSRKFPLLILDTYFGGGMSSRLFQKLREEQGLSYSVYSFLDFWSDSGLWGVYASTSPETLECALEAIRTETGLLVREGMPAAALERVKSQIIGNLLLTYEDCGHRMSRLAKMEAYTESYTPIERVMRCFRSVTMRDIRAAAESVLYGMEPFTVLLKPGKIH